MKILLSGGTSKKPMDSEKQRKNSVVYPVRHMIMAGTFSEGIVFYGPWKNEVDAQTWAFHTLKDNVRWRLEEVLEVKE